MAVDDVLLHIAPGKVALLGPNGAGRSPTSPADIARRPRLSEGTVRDHLSAAIGKTGARTRVEAVRLAEQNGWLLGR